jgi:CubicO group peptidase (beta-lactamase class C family)
MRIFLSAILLLLLCSQCYAGETQASVVHPLTHDDVEAYFDGFFPDALTRADIAGAVVVVVKDGRIVLEKGYGYANMASRKPVDPQKTLFRPGSVSKLFIWTAVMQLVEQHKLDLDRDVNEYLDFRIPAAFGKPITLRHLMTHTAGFEEHLKSIMVYDPRRLQSLRAMLADRTPKRIFPPGEISAYSNYGACLAAYIVQRVSGEDFDHYVAQHIFAPLQMTRATFVQPLSAKLSSDLAQSYNLASDPPKPSELYNLGPSGGSYATGEDMAHFMIAHLNEGSYGGASILRPETATLMHQTAFQPAPPLREWRLASIMKTARASALLAMAAIRFTFTVICTSSWTAMSACSFR